MRRTWIVTLICATSLIGCGPNSETSRTADIDPDALYTFGASRDDLETRFGVTNGALTHGELTLDQILFMRPVAGFGRHAMPIDGLYLGGRGAHPGPAILGGAGWLAARAAVTRAAKRPQRASR